MATPTLDPPRPVQRVAKSILTLPIARAAAMACGSAWPRVLGRLAQRIGGFFPATPLGLALAALIVWAYRTFAVQHGDQVLLAATLIGGGILCLSVVTVVVTSLWIRWRIEATLHPITLETGAKTQTGYCLGRVQWNPLVQIEVGWDLPGQVEVTLAARQGSWFEEIRADWHGKTQRIVRHFVVTDLLGLSRIVVRRSSRVDVTLLPHRGAAGPMSLVRHWRGGDELADPAGSPEGDRIEMRRYAPGDPLKLVLWKVYARTGRLLVRTPERAIAPCQRTLAYLVAAREVGAAAGIARAVVASDTLGRDSLFLADGEAQPTRDGKAAIEQILRSGQAGSRAGKGLAMLLEIGRTAGLSACVMFLPAEEGPWINRVLECMDRSTGPYQAVICVDGWRAANDRPGWCRWLRAEGNRSGADMATARRIAERFEAARAQVTIVDRVTGRVCRAADLEI